MALDLLWVQVGLVLIVGTGFFVASEFALVNLDRNDLEGRQKRGENGLGLTIIALKIISTSAFMRCNASLNACFTPISG